MRVAPIGFAFDDPSDAGDLARRAAALTHGHPTGHLAADAFARLIALIRSGTPLSYALVIVAKDLAYTEGGAETSDALIAARALLGRTIDPTAEDIQALGEGWVADEALIIAVACALVARDFEHGMLLAVNHGGDSDSTGAMCGALMGTMFGASAIPPRWLAVLEHGHEIAEIADDLHAMSSEDGEIDLYGQRWQGRWPAE